MQKKITRILAIIMILSPWIFVPMIYKDIIFATAGLTLLLSTIDIKKKVKTDI